jgi:uncharacterized protein YaiE (UPF0345 family)
MGKTFSTGLLTNGIWQDASNNIGIGGSPSGSYKFEVTGTARVSGLLTGANATFGSTGTGNNIIALSNNDQSNTRLRITNTGSGGQTFSIVGGNPGASNAGLAIFDETNSATRLYVGSTGNVGIGVSNPSSIFEVAQTNGIITQRGNTGYSVFRSYGGDGTNSDVVEFQIRNRVDGSNMVSIGNFTSHDLTFRTANTERMRITSGGYTQITSTNSYASTSSTAHAIISNRNNDNNLYLVHSGSNPYGPYIWFTNAAPNNTTNYFLLCSDSSADRFSFRSNGGLANYQANNVNLSDARTKKDIIPLESYWDKFKAIEIVKFKYKDQTHDDFNIGVIAQQVEEVAPEFVDIDGWSKPKLDDDGNQIISEEEPLKAIYTADLHHATIKVLQEAMSKIEELEAKVSALENKS